MTLRTATTVFAPKTLAQWRASVAAQIGVAYASLDSAAQTELDDYIDETHDYISKRWGHEPWTMREWTVSLASGTATFQLAKDVRHVELFVENDGTDTQQVQIVTKSDFLRAYDGSSAHPWDDQDNPRYFYDGEDDSDPALQQWKRAPSPTSSLTITVHGRPYFATMASDDYPGLKASHRGEIRRHLKMLWAAFNEDDAGVQRQMALREDAIKAGQINDNPTGAAEVAIRPDMPSEFYREMG